jgi:hypothetical protein
VRLWEDRSKDRSGHLPKCEFMESFLISLFHQYWKLITVGSRQRTLMSFLHRMFLNRRARPRHRSWPSFIETIASECGCHARTLTKTTFQSTAGPAHWRCLHLSPGVGEKDCRLQHWPRESEPKALKERQSVQGSMSLDHHMAGVVGGNPKCCWVSARHGIIDILMRLFEQPLCTAL